jgi:hypothetical protein
MLNSRHVIEEIVELKLKRWHMFVKIKPGRLRDLDHRHQCFLKERRRYFADDVGGGVLIELLDQDATLELYLDNSLLERFTEGKPHRPVKEYRYSLSSRRDSAIDKVHPAPMG